MGWQEFNAQTLFPGPTKEILRATGEVADTVAESAETAAGAIDTIASLLVDISDPARAIVEALIQQLKNLLTDTMNTGLYMYWDTAGFPFYKLRSFDKDEFAKAMNGDSSAELPLSAATPIGWTGWKSRWQQSFDDQGDDRRPIFSGDAQVSAMIFIAGTPSLDALPALLAALGRLFGIKAFTDLLDMLAITQLAEDAKAGEREIIVKNANGFVEDKFVIIGALSGVTLDFASSRQIDYQTRVFTLYDDLKKDWPAGTPVIMAGSDPQSRGGNKRAPDWHSCKLKDLDVMKKVDKLVKKIIGLLEMASGLIGLLQELADALAEKADQLRDLAQEIEDAIELIELIIALTGVYCVKIDSTTGIGGLFDALEAQGQPPLPAGSYIVGVCLLAGTNELLPITELFGA
jgi:hypothetical protein